MQEPGGQARHVGSTEHLPPPGEAPGPDQSELSTVLSTNHSSPGLLLHLLHAAAVPGLGQRHEAALRALLQPGLGVVVVRHELRVQGY